MDKGERVRKKEERKEATKQRHSHVSECCFFLCYKVLRGWIIKEPKNVARTCVYCHKNKNTRQGPWGQGYRVLK